MEKELEIARRIARDAGKVLLEYYAGETKVQWKGYDDPVTAADKAANELIVRELQKAFPNDAILSEEAPDDLNRLQNQRVWFVDPMDGTKQFIERIDEFAVMIGLAVAGEPQVGVVYNPTIDRMFFAAPGIGAYVEEALTTKRLRVSTLSDTTQMATAMSRSHHNPLVNRVCAQLGIAKEIRSGSVGLKMGLIADGQAHAYIHLGAKTNQWDTCAPVAILHAAGGQATDNHGAPLQFNTPGVRNLTGIIASNGTQHEAILAAVKEVLTDPHVNE